MPTCRLNAEIFIGYQWEFLKIWLKLNTISDKYLLTRNILDILDIQGVPENLSPPLSKKSTSSRKCLSTKEGGDQLYKATGPPNT